MTPKILLIISSCSLAGALGCASSTQPPNSQWAAAQAEVGRAEASGAANVPDAKLHLQRAREDLSMSREAMINDDNVRATTLSDLAQTEARLARSLTRRATAENEARQVEEDSQKPNP